MKDLTLKFANKVKVFGCSLNEVKSCFNPTDLRLFGNSIVEIVEGIHSIWTFWGNSTRPSRFGKVKITWKFANVEK